ncbi:MAG: hypothetical protein ACI8VT_003731, partial [Saprospiraceae bacterium]
NMLLTEVPLFFMHFNSDNLFDKVDFIIYKFLKYLS